MSKKTLTLLVGAIAFTFVAIAVYAANNTNSTPMDNTSVSSAQVCAKSCDKNLENCDKYEDCNCKCENCEGDCENCDKDCCANCENCDSCDKPCKSKCGDSCCSQSEETGTCQKSQGCGGCSGK